MRQLIIVAALTLITACTGITNKPIPVPVSCAVPIPRTETIAVPIPRAETIKLYFPFFLIPSSTI